MSVQSGNCSTGVVEHICDDENDVTTGASRLSRGRLARRQLLRSAKNNLSETLNLTVTRRADGIVVREVLLLTP